MDFSSVRTRPRVKVLPFGKLRRGPGADQVKGPLARMAVVGAAYRFAINGHHLSGQQLRHSLAPFHEAFLEAVRVQTGEYVTEGIMGRDTVGQLREGAKPFLLAHSEHGHMNPGVGPTNHRTYGCSDDVR